MPMQQVEFEFPEGDKEEETKKVESKQEEVVEDTTDEIEIEIIDDTPEEDRNRKPAPPPKDVTDDELAEYSEKVQKRIKHFNKGYHDERRAREAAERQRDEMAEVTKNLYEEVSRLRSNNDRSQSVILEQAKKQVANEMEVAKRMYKEAYESGDPDALVAAQEALTTAKIRADKVASFKPKPLQTKENPVQNDTNTSLPPRTQQPRPQPDPKAQAWREENRWFGGSDPTEQEMTDFALSVDRTLKAEGVDPRSDEYYERINSRMRKVYSEYFESGDLETPEARKGSSNVVAPATRSTAPKKVRLTPSQTQIAKRLGLSNEQYAREAAKLMRKQ